VVECKLNPCRKLNADRSVVRDAALLRDYASIKDTIPHRDRLTHGGVEAECVARADAITRIVGPPYLFRPANVGCCRLGWRRDSGKGRKKLAKALPEQEG